MSISRRADILDMSLQWGDRTPAERDDRDAELAMALMEAGVPLRLLVDIALPLGLIRDLYADAENAAQG